MHNDPIAELITKLMNAKKAHKPEITVQATNMKKGIASLLASEGYIESFSITAGAKPEMTIKLKYKNQTSSLTGMRQISKPGLRIYSQAATLKKVNNGLGIAIISTSRGIMTDKQAREANVGGEVIAYV